MNIPEKLKSRFGIHDNLAKCILCEFFCTALLVFAGTSTSAQHTLSKGTQGSWTEISFGWGFSVMLAIYAGFNISGSHLNPAVSLFLCTLGRLSWHRCILYSISQILGAFIGSFFTWILYYDALNAYDGGLRVVAGDRGTGGIFCTYPHDFLSIAGGIADQVIGTAYLCICISIITDKHNKIPNFIQPFLLGLVIVQVGISIGMNGYAINTARDLGPRLFTLVAGWGTETFSYNNYKWFWIPTFCPLVGGVIGAWIYQLFLGNQSFLKLLKALS
uniref:Aquaporin n=1 Tax=Syphacia muris TaxID=451379 RepID=A0A0N5APF9_9BILA